MNMRAWVCAGLLVSLALPLPIASAVDVPIPLRLYLNRADGKTKFIAKGTFPLPDASTDNPAMEGGEITFRQGASSETISLPAANWSARGTPPGAKGFKYTDLTGATCKRVRLTGALIKGVCKATAPGAPPFDASSDAPVEIVLSIGTATQRYCAECPNGGEQRGDPQKLTKLINCLAPLTCPAAAAETPTATETPTSTATTTSTETPTATETPTPTPDGVCCDYAAGCSSASSSFVCTKLTGGTGFSGLVCDATGNCVPPPGTPGACCENAVILPFCSMVADQATCESSGGTFHSNAVCEPSAVCTDQ